MRLRLIVLLAIAVVILGVFVVAVGRDRLSELRPYAFSDKHRYFYESGPQHRATEERYLKLRGISSDKVTEIVKKRYRADQGWRWYKTPIADRRDNSVESIGVLRQGKGETNVQAYRLLPWFEVIWVRAVNLGKDPFERP